MRTTNFPKVSAPDWRAQVDKELAGAPFDRTLVARTPEGLAIQPLYTEAPAGEPVGVEARGEAFRVCIRIGAGAGPEDVAAELEGGAEALWIAALPPGGVNAALEGVDLERTF